VILVFCILSSPTNCKKPKQRWFTFPIKNQSNSKTEYVINKAIEQLSQSGVFHLKKVLSITGIAMYKREIKDILEKYAMSAPSYKSIQAEVNIFDDEGDITFKSKHPRNKKYPLKLSGIPRWQITPNIISFYEYKPLISFFKTIITSTKHELPLCDPWSFDCKQWNDLHIGTSKETSSIFIGVFKPGDFGAFTIDQAGFRCEFIIDEAEYGGDFSFQFIAPKPITEIIKRKDEDTQIRGRGFDWDWKLIKKVLNEDIEVKSFRPGSGDLYCWKGNVTMSRVEYVDGDNIRTSISMSFYETHPALAGGKPQEVTHTEL